jgi:hypothetical protein
MTDMVDLIERAANDPSFLSDVVSTHQLKTVLGMPESSQREIAETLHSLDYAHCSHCSAMSKRPMLTPRSAADPKRLIAVRRADHITRLCCRRFEDSREQSDFTAGSYWPGQHHAHRIRLLAFGTEHRTKRAHVRWGLHVALSVEPGNG